MRRPIGIQQRHALPPFCKVPRRPRAKHAGSDHRHVEFALNSQTSLRCPVILSQSLSARHPPPLAATVSGDLSSPPFPELSVNSSLSPVIPCIVSLDVIWRFA